MQNISKPNSAVYQTGLRFLIIVVLVLGVFFRFTNLDRRVYTGDETATSIRISGYTRSELVQQVFDGRVISVDDLQKYQRTNPEKGLFDTVKSLAIEDPHHPPLYYVIARFAVQLFGNSATVTRGVAAVISLLVFPSIYWLCRELFPSPLVGWVAIALIAVSPFHLAQAQNAREYTLWTVAILLSSAALLRTMRINTKRTWSIYGATVVLGLYSHLFFWFVAIGHGIYVFVQEGFRKTKIVNAYLFASSVAVLLFIPFPILINRNITKVYSETTWTASKLPFLFGDDTLVKRWADNLSSTFCYLDFAYDQPLILYLLGCIFTILVIYSVYFLCRNTPKKVWLFVLILMASTALPLVLPDLILGGQRSAANRYLIPSYLGIQLAVAFLLATQMTSISVNIWRQKLWQLIAVGLISSGVLSCAFSPIGTRFSELDSQIIPVARIINQAAQPLFILDMRPYEILPYSYRLDSKVRLQLVVRPNVPKVPDGFSDVFLYRPSNQLRNRLIKEQKYNAQEVDKSLNLWRLRKISKNLF